MTHFCMLYCQKELTHAFLHWLVSLTCGRLASMGAVSVCAETHVFLRTGIFSALFAHIFPTVAYQRSYMKKQAHAAQLMSNESFHQPIVFAQINLNLFWKKDFLFPHHSPYNCSISDHQHIGIMISWPMTLEVDFLRFEGHLSVIDVKMRIHNNITWINRKVLSELHEIRTFRNCCVLFCAKY